MTIKNPACDPILILPSVIPDENIILSMERDDLFPLVGVHILPSDLTLLKFHVTHCDATTLSMYGASRHMPQDLKKKNKKK